MLHLRMMDTSNSESETFGESERNGRYVSNRNRQDSPWVAHRYYGNRSRWIAVLIWIAVCWTMLCGYINLVLMPSNGELPVDLNHGVIGRDEMHLVSVSLPDERISYWNPEGRQRVKAIDALMGRQRLRNLSAATETATETETQAKIDATSETIEGQTKQLNDTAVDGQTRIDYTNLVASNTIIFIFILLCAALRICTHIGVLGGADGPGSSSRRFLEMDPNGVLTFRGSIARTHFQRQRRQQLSNLIDRLNAQRVTNGERPMSIESLRLVLSNRDFNSNDYESLWTFQDDNGPSTLSYLRYVGATEAEISRCPQRTIKTQQDDLIVSDNLSDLTNTKPSHRTACAICLEQFKIGDTVRTIPCFHTFHTTCIDPWLRNKAICPICKHTAIS